MHGKAPELPLGLGMALAQNCDALNQFGSLSAEKQSELVSYIQSATTGNDAKERIEHVVRDLSQGI